MCQAAAPQGPVSRRVCLFLFAIFSLTFASFSLPAQADTKPVAAIIAQRGLLLVQAGGSGPFQALKSQRPLLAGDVVRTGPDGEAAILFDDGSQVKLHSNASLRITSGRKEMPRQNLFQALFGVIWAHLRPGQTIQTPTANIVVRGTDVLLSVDPDGTTTVTVTQGNVLFFNTLGTVALAAAQQSVARPGQAPTPPVAVDVTGLIAWTADVAGLPLEFEDPALTPGLSSADGSAAEEIRLAAETVRHPVDPAAWVSLGNARRGLGDLPGAQAAFTEAERLAPNNLQARAGSALTFLTQNRTREARGALAPVQDQAAAQAILGLADLHEGKAADAAQHFQAALAQDPALYTARALLALTELTRNDLPTAEAAARAAVHLQPDSAQTQGTLAMVLFFAGKTDEAETASRQAVRLNPRSPFALLTEGRTLQARQQTDAARSEYEKAAALAPSLWLIHEELGEVYLRLDMPPKAGEEYQIALTLDPDSADAHTGLGTVYQKQGRFADAEKELRRAAALAPASATAHYALAALLIDRGHLAEARQELETGVRSAPERGILYARLAELSLYRQDLFEAQEFALHAVRLLPASAPAHYALGRVYLEQERTVQAEEEFRQATTLDRHFAEARYALGLTEEKTEGGLLNSFSSLLGSALVGSPGSTLSLENLQTPGANQRIQAALLDPTAVRVASRSYGDAQIDGQLGEKGTRDAAGSFLTDTAEGRGVRGITGEEQAANGVRAGADSKTDTASLVFGQKATGNPSGLFILGDYQETSGGLDNAVASDPYLALLRYHTKLPRLIVGANVQTGAHSQFRALVQDSSAEEDASNTTVINDTLRNHLTSLSGEMRWDAGLGEANLISAGLSYGNRHLLSNRISAPDNSTPSVQELIVTRVRPFQLYVRDEYQASKRVSLIGEIQVLQLSTFSSTEFPGQSAAAFPPGQESTATTVGLPTFVVSYQPDARSGLRFRARRTFAALSDFELLTPTDVFLLSYAGLPQVYGLFNPAHGTSLELEYDRTFANASFLRVGVFQQDFVNPRFIDVPAASVSDITKARLRGARVSYEGLMTPELSFLFSVDLNDARDTDRGQRIPQVPNFGGLATLQYLNRQGVYGQVAVYYQGSRLLATDQPDMQGGFGVLNLRLGKRFGLRTDVFAELNNVLNKRYDVFGYLQSGRLLQIGISQRF